MRNIFSLTITALMLVFMASCKVSPCDKKLCDKANYVEYEDSCECQCPFGLEGPNCDQPIVNRFTGSNLSTVETWKNSNKIYYYTSYISGQTYDNSLDINPALYQMQLFYGSQINIQEDYSITVDYPMLRTQNYNEFRFHGKGRRVDDKLIIDGSISNYNTNVFVDSIHIEYQY